jgi:hypothetical protein
MHEIHDHDLPRLRIAKANDGRDAGERLGSVSATAVIAGLLSAGHLRRSHLCELLLRAIAVVSERTSYQVVRCFAISVQAAALEVWPLIGVQPEPIECLEDDPNGLLGGTLAVGILDAQDVLAAVTAGIQP